MSGPIRVGIRLSPGLRVWAGGYNYVRNLLTVIRAYAEGHVQPILFSGPGSTAGEFGELTALVDAPVAIDTVWAGTSSMRTARAITTGSDLQAARVLKKLRIDVLFEQGAFYGRNFPIPTLVWMADFQHCYLPEMFGPLGAFKRNMVSRLKTAGDRMIMVSSHTARMDCIKFYGVADERISVVPFAVLPSAHVTDPESVREQYGIPERFFFLPNQLWKHKNHRLVCEAVSLLRKRGEQICVVASGSTADPRNPLMYDELRAFIASEGIEQNFRHLGIIPYDHLIALLRGATALINPSLFEGWSTTVEEAKTYGVPLLVSDIAVHREQCPPGSVMFDPDSAEELSRVLATARDSLPPGPRPHAEVLALSGTLERAGRFADDFCTAVHTTLARG